MVSISIIIIVIRNKEIVLLQEGGHPLADRGANIKPQHGDQEDLRQLHVSGPAWVGSEIRILLKVFCLLGLCRRKEMELIAKHFQNIITFRTILLVKMYFLSAA